MKSRICNPVHLALFAICISAFIQPTVSFAQPVVIPQTPPATSAKTQKAQDETNSAPPPGEPAKQTYGGLSFGVGIGLTVSGKRDRVAAASIDSSNIVRVTQTDNAIAGIILESHYFFTPAHDFFGVPKGAWGHGPFVAIQADTGGNSSTIAAYALGWMIGLREPQWRFDGVDDKKRPDWTATYSNISWNFGVGVRIDPRAQILGDGFVANQPPPAGATQVQLKQVPRYGLMILSSFGF